MADIAGVIEVGVGGTPTINPETGFIDFYGKDDDKLYYLTASGVEYWITASGVVPPNFTLLDLTDTPDAYSNGLYLKSTTSGTEWATASGGGGSSDHATLSNLDYASAAHTGFASTAALTSTSGTLQDEIDNIDPSTTLEEARSNGNTFSGTVDYNNNDIDNIRSIGFYGGQDVTWNTDDLTLDVPTGIGPVLQVGREMLAKVYNGTGAEIPNGAVVYPTGAVGGTASVSLAIATTFEGFASIVLVTTMAIPDGEYGFVTTMGKVRDVDLSSFSLGDTLYLSSTVSGGLVNTAPEFPNYTVQLGGVALAGVSGTLQLAVKGDAHITTQNFWNGTFRESIDLLVSSSGATVTGTLTPSNGSQNNLTMMFSDGFTTLETPTTVVLTAGTDTNPQTNYIYVPDSTKVLTASTTAWASEEHIKVAQVALFSANTTATEGSLRNQNWNDHIQGTDGQGHMSHITAAIREKIGATWSSGCEGTVTISGTPTPDDVWVSTTAGVVKQLHDQSVPAFNTLTGDNIHVVNHNTTPYDTITNLNTQLADSQGNTLNNTSFSFVLWGIANKGGTAQHLMLNLPTDSYAYASPTDAVNDAFNYSVYTIPQQFHGVGFLIARFTFTYKNNVWTIEDTEDLRGMMPNSTAGGGGGGTGVTSFLGLTDTPSAYTGEGEKFVRVASGETALEFVAGDYFSTAGGTISGNVTIEGNLTVTGTEFIAHTEDLYVKDNLIVLNYGETGGGVTKGHAGVEIDRGTEDAYQFMFVEATEDFRVGVSGTNLQAVATREDTPTNTYVPYWNSTLFRYDTAGSMAYTAIALKANVLELDNTTPFTPDADYEPVTKKYFDDNLPEGLDLDPTPDSDHTSNGITADLTVGESVVFGDLLYMKSDGKLWKADATDDTAVPAMAMANATISADASGSVLLQGFARDDTWTWTIGGMVFASITAGAMSQTAPTDSAEMVQAVGVATHADRFYFNPNYAMGEVA